MGICTEMWRARIGVFCQPRKSPGDKIQTLKPKCMGLCIRVALFLLLAAQCIETNPGPPKTTDAQKSRAPSRSRRIESATANVDDVSSHKQTNCDLNDNIDLSQTTRQTTIDSMFSSIDSDVSLQRNSASTSASNNIDITSVILEVSANVKSMNSKFDNLSLKVNQLQIENDTLKEQNRKLDEKVSGLTDKLNNTEKLLSEQVSKQERLDYHSRQKNLKFHGFNAKSVDTPEAAETKVREFITDSLGINGDDIEFDRLRLTPGKSEHRPLIVQFSQLKQRDTVLKGYRSKRKQGELPIRVAEDLPEMISKSRAGLYPLLQSSLQEGKRAFFKHDKLVVNEDIYYYDLTNKKICMSAK